jgi:putative redox protein
MKARIKWVEDVLFVGESDSGHTVVIDGAPEHGGRDLGIRPMELLLQGLGSCTTFDVLLILKKARQLVTDLVVEIEAERAKTDPKVFTQIHIHFIISGNNISEKHVQRAIQLSAEKYCSASIMLAKSVEITHDYEILNEKVGVEQE